MEQMIKFRVVDTGPMQHFSKSMTEEEIVERRAEIRQILKETCWNDLSDDALDNIRLLQEEKYYLLEDTDGCWFYIPGKGVSQEEMEFRKVRAMEPFEFINLTGKDFDWTIYGNEDVDHAKQCVSDFIVKFPAFRDKGMGLYIYSSVKGSGKTMLSCCVLNELAKRYSVSIKFINALDLIELTKKSYKGIEPEELEGLYHASVLVIDDLGVQMSKEWVDTVFYRLINTRYANKLVTIYTSNISAKFLKLDDRIIDRIESTTYPIPIPEIPIRSRIRKEERDKLLEEIRKSPA